jgi:glycosyltransferase involved in cell wall biosynthesis
MKKSSKRDNLPSLPQVSIIMPTYNRAYVIAKAIRSVLRQNFKDFELIVVSDGSSDNTKTVVSRFQDSRIRYFEKVHGGRASACNLGLRFARGEYVAYLDDDDSWYPNHLKELSGVLKRHPRVGLVYSDVLICAKGNAWVMRKDFDKEILESQCLPVGSATMHRYACLDTVGCFDETLLRAQDWDMWLRISDEYKIKRLPKITVRFTHHDPPEQAIVYYKKVIDKRVAKAKREGCLAAYIESHAIKIITNFIQARDISFASKMARRFARESNNYHSFTCLALCEYANSNYRQAVKHFARALRLLLKARRGAWSQYRFALTTIEVNLANAYVRLKKINLAFKHYAQLVALFDNDVAKEMLAYCYLRTKKYHSMLRLLREVKGVNAHALRGACYYAQGKYAMAWREYLICARRAPRVIQYRYNLGTVALRLGNVKKARQQFRKVSQLEREGGNDSRIVTHSSMGIGNNASPLRGLFSGDN